GVYRGPEGKPKDGLHDISVVGIGYDSGDLYVEIRNSFGNNWCDGGYAKILAKYVSFDCHVDGAYIERRGGGGGYRGGIKVEVNPHSRLEGVFIAKGKKDVLCTKNMVPGKAVVFNEKRVSVQNKEYRVWNPYRCKLAAAILCGIEGIWAKPGSSVLYLGAASGTTVSHVSDIVGPNGVVYAVEYSDTCSRDLVKLAKKRTNIVPIIQDARYPGKYRMLVGMVDVIISDIAQPDQARILGLNASYFLKAGGHFVISIKPNSIDSTIPAELVLDVQVKRLQVDQFKPVEQLTLGPYWRDHAVIRGGYRMPKKIYATTTS
ncbi:hypothetical protein MIMGU_mgv1a026684mg, partial [Erythranthe guttata]